MKPFGRPLDNVTPEPTVAAEDRAWVVASFVYDACELSAEYYYRVYQSNADCSIQTRLSGKKSDKQDYIVHVDFQIDGVLSDIPLDQIADERRVRISAFVDPIDSDSLQDEQMWRLHIGHFVCDLVLRRNDQSTVLAGETSALHVADLRPGWAGKDFEAVFFGRIL